MPSHAEWRRLLSLGGFGLVVLLMGCGSDVTEPDPERIDASIQTDRDRYEAEVVGGSGTYTRYGFTLIAEFHNPTDRVLYLSRCFPDSPAPMYGVQLLGEEDVWGAAYNEVWGCVGHGNQFQIEPGETRTDVLDIVGPTIWDGRTDEPFGVLEGTFRLTYDLRYCPNTCEDVVPHSLTYSDPFVVELVE